MTTPYFTEQALADARQRLDRQGISVREWAEENSMKAGTVYEVLAGRKRCRRGDAHRAAVLLGIKEGVVAQ